MWFFYVEMLPHVCLRHCEVYYKSLWWFESALPSSRSHGCRGTWFNSSVVRILIHGPFSYHIYSVFILGSVFILARSLRLREISVLGTWCELGTVHLCVCVCFVPDSEEARESSVWTCMWLCF